MLYTTYLSNIRNIPNTTDSVCILVTRWKPKNTINTDKYNFDIIWEPNLGPSETLLTRWKSSEDMKWSEYRRIYLSEASSNKEFKRSMNKIINLLKSEKNVFLVCYEKEYHNCHRSILKEIFLLNKIECNEY